MKDREAYIVTFAAAPGWSAPPAVRLRKLLKIAGRQLGLRCIAIQPAQTAAAAADDSQADPPPGKAADA